MLDITQCTVDMQPVFINLEQREETKFFNFKLCSQNLVTKGNEGEKCYRWRLKEIIPKNPEN